METNAPRGDWKMNLYEKFIARNAGERCVFKIDSKGYYVTYKNSDYRFYKSFNEIQNVEFLEFLNRTMRQEGCYNSFIID